MSNAAAMAEAEAVKAVPVGGRKEPRNYIFWFAVVWLVLVLLITIFGEWLPIVDDPNERNADTIKKGPSWDNWFGTATFGQDVFSRVVVGGRISLRVAAIGTAVGIGVGGTLGLLAGFYRGWVDSIVRLIINVTLSIPALLLVIFIVAVRDQSLFWVVFAVCILAIPALARIVRASTLQVAEREYVKAAEVVGAKRLSILFREVLPNVMPTMISFAFLTTGIILVAESSLSFLGLSVEAPTITWGSIIAEGRISFQETPHMVFLPAVVLFLTVLSLNFIGDQLLKRYDIRESAL
ncbi:MAG: ABC transporter permease [Acidimicrobiia bacterium]|nr:ABC transporter permease [Acidimicrobiia bacterium]